MDIQKALSTGIAYHNSGQLKEAERIYRDILKVANTHPIALTLLAKLYFTNGKYNEVKKIDWNECYYRNDIGHKALKNED